MKSVIYLTTCILLASMASCSSGGKKEKDDTVIVSQDSLTDKGLQCMQRSEAKMTFEYKGKKYESLVVRRPDEGLPVVTNEQGERFADNRIRLYLTCGGKTVVDKEFTKEDFAGQVDEKFLKNAILEGMVYDKTTPEGILYAASVCYPQTDLYMPLRLTVTAEGKITIAREELLEDLYEDGKGE